MQHEDITTIIESELNESLQVLQAFMSDEKNIESISQAAETIVASLKQGKKIISCGNGGSMSDAMHFAEELTGKFRNSRPSVPAIAISDPSFISCTANDFGYDFIFSRYIESIGNEGDILIGISTSGNSRNVINAVEQARQKGMTTIVLTGKDGGELAKLADIEIRVLHNGYADRIQEVHIKIIHILIHLIEQSLGY